LEKAFEQLKRYPVDKLADSDIVERAAKQYVALAERYAETSDSARSMACLGKAIDVAPAHTAHWFRYQQSRMGLKQRNLRKAFQGLFTIARIPDAPRPIIEKILSPAGVARVAPYWPASPKSILKPLILCLSMFGWFFRRLTTSGLPDLHTSITAVILVWLFVVRHFVHRLRAESSSIRKLFYRI
jgi:hypothetical protein